jgi:AraC family transcriptional regulator of adaptative response/methylated-DNA-[protein]-cysteine methyltransferase
MTLNVFDRRENLVPSPGNHDGVTYTFGTTSLGQVLVAATESGICAIFLGSDRNRLVGDLRRHFPDAQPSEKLADEIAKVVGLIEDPASSVDLTLDLQGSDFEVAVWQALRAVQPGKTLSYSELAWHLGETGGAKGAAKDVADACAANKIAVAVPCHRILRKDGTISGYRWGVHRKRALLKREGVQ